MTWLGWALYSHSHNVCSLILRNFIKLQSSLNVSIFELLFNHPDLHTIACVRNYKMENIMRMLQSDKRVYIPECIGTILYLRQYQIRYASQRTLHPQRQPQRDVMRYSSTTQAVVRWNIGLATTALVGPDTDKKLYTYVIIHTAGHTPESQNILRRNVVILQK
jgi:hypothetical protein